MLKYIKIFKGTPTFTNFNVCWAHLLHVLLPQGSQRTPATCIAATRVTTYTCYMYCCHNAGVDRRDFKFSVLNLKKILKFLNNPVTLARCKHTS